MMTRESFVAAIKAYRKVEFISVGFFTLFMFAAGLAVRLISARSDRVGFDIICVAMTVVSFIFIAYGMFYSMARWPQKKLHALGVECPHCRKALVGLSSQVAVATGNCGFCGGKVLDMDQPPKAK